MTGKRCSGIINPLFDGITDNTRGHFTHCSHFSSPLRSSEKFYATRKISTRIIWKTIEWGVFIKDPLLPCPVEVFHLKGTTSLGFCRYFDKMMLKLLPSTLAHTQNCSVTPSRRYRVNFDQIFWIFITIELEQVGPRFFQGLSISILATRC